jgi:predicted RNA-binding Zn-ribbon protein involved in translation (DUF1610 family)
MDAFSPVPPPWTDAARHAYQFVCPSCGASAAQAQAVWINRRAPVYTAEQRRKWQEFYHCGECETVWWAWSSDRPPAAGAEDDLA